MSSYCCSVVRGIFHTIVVVQARCPHKDLVVHAICKGNVEASNRLANVAVTNYEGSVINVLYYSDVGD